MADPTNQEPNPGSAAPNTASGPGTTTSGAPAPAEVPASGPGAAKPPKKRRIGWMVAIAVVVIVIVGVIVWRYLDRYESTDDAQVYGHVNSISTRVSGYVTDVKVNDNQYVDKGAVLVQIDPRDYQVAVEQAQADLADAEANARAANLNIPVQTIGTTSQISSSVGDVAAAEAGVSASQKQAEAAGEQVKQAEANNARAQEDLARYQELLSKDEVSRQIYEQALATAKSNAAAVAAAHDSAAAAEHQVMQAQGHLEQSQAALRSSQSGPQQVAATRARAQAALAAVKQKQAALDQAQLNLQYCTVVAPVAGVVNKNVEVGMNVQPGQTLLMIVPLDDVWIVADFKETQLNRMQPGQRVSISVDAYSHDYKGRVDSISGASGAIFSLLPPENATGNYVKVVQRVPVKIVLDQGENNDHRLRLGMSVEAKVWVK